MLRLEKVTGRNVWDILKLRVRDEQTNFVAGNDISIIEAYTAVTGGGHAFPFGIYEDQVPVGFLMVERRRSGLRCRLSGPHPAAGRSAAGSPMSRIILRPRSCMAASGLRKPEIGTEKSR